MNFRIDEIEIKNLDRLGIFAGIIDEIGIVEKVNELLATDPREKINCGEVVKAIILNGLGFVAQLLYLFSNFFKDKAVEHLLGAGVKAEELNDDRLGRVMDQLYKYGLNNLFLIRWQSIAHKYGDRIYLVPRRPIQPRIGKCVWLTNYEIASMGLMLVMRFSLRL